jgi:hypothetical protein
VFSALLVLSDASSFFCFLARFMLLGSFFTWVYFLLEPSSFHIDWNTGDLVISVESAPVPASGISYGS